VFSLEAIKWERETVGGERAAKGENSRV